MKTFPTSAQPSEQPSWIAPDLPDGAYDLFISYRSEKSGRHAVALRDALYALDKRAHGNRPMRIFLDRISLKTGELSANILQGLHNSRHLVVLLDETTIGSPWVDLEILQWLEAGGAPERLSLIRTSTTLDLSWDPTTGNFRQPDALPPSLSGLFTKEQKYIDFAVPPRRINEVDLVGLYASVMGADPEKVGEDERRFLERERSRTRKFITVLVGLLIAALVAGSIAVVNSIRADKAARQARADALAAESLLTIPVSPARAIELAVEAADLGTGASVRAALLAVAADTGRLERTFQFTALSDATSLSGLSLSPDELTLTVWGPSADDTSVTVVTFSTFSGDVMQSFAIERSSIQSLVEIPGVAFLGCSGDEALKIDWHDHGTEVLASGLSSCTAHSLVAGGILETETAKEDMTPMESIPRRLLGVSASGEPIDIAGWLSSGSRADSIRAIGGYTTMTHLFTPEGIVEVDDDAQGFPVSRSNGTVTTYTQDRKFHVLSMEGSDLTHATVDAGSGWSGAAGWVDYSGTAQAAWLTASGQVSWSGGSGIRLPAGSGNTSSTRVALIPIQYSTLIAVFDNQVFSLSPSSGRIDGQKLGEFTGEATSIQSCGSTVIINDDYYVANATTADSSFARPTLIRGHAEIRNCLAVEPGPPFKINGQELLESVFVPAQLSDFFADGRVLLAEQDGTVSLIIARANRQASAQEIPTPWRFTPQLKLMTAAGGTATFSTASNSLQIARGNDTYQIESDRDGKWTLPRPDGRGGLAFFSGDDWLVNLGDDPLPLVDQCTDPRFFPGDGFESDLLAATSPHPVSWPQGLTGPRIDCVTGEGIAFDGEILAYDIGPDLGYIVWLEDGATWITTWTANAKQSTTRRLPGQHTESDVAAINAQGTRILVGSAALDEYRLEGGDWVRTGYYTSTAGPVSTAAYTPDGTLAMAVSSDGRFDIFDTQTKRRLASQLEALPIGDDYQDLMITEHDGYLLAHLRDSSGGTLIEMPMAIAPLRDLLCYVHHAPACD